MIRVCYHEDCPRPHHIFGCVFYTAQSRYCDDCKRKKPKLYQQCSIREVAPPPEDATHGLCRDCAKLVINNMKKRHRNKATLQKMQQHQLG